MRVSLFALWAAVLLVQTRVYVAYNILGIFPKMTRSHYITGGALMRGLAAAGHNVTVISPFPQKKPLANFRDYSIFGAGEAFKSAGLMPDMLQISNTNAYRATIETQALGIQITNFTLTHPRMTKFLNDPNEHFDLVICEVFINEAMLGFGQHFNAPVIAFSTFGSSMWTNDLVGTPMPISYVPHPNFRFTDKITFLERFGNTLMTFADRILYYRYLSAQEQIYQEVFPGTNKPSLAEIRKDIAFVLLNQHFTTSTPRPFLPNMVEIGGININRGPPNLLPKDIKTFIEGAKHGVVYFSMGSILRSTQLSIDIREGLLRTFGKLKQRVLWKWEDPNLPGKPDNVLISSWFPQDDILAHPNVKVFITHGGLLSLTESVYHGLPVIGIPIFGDQPFNIALAQTNGYGIMIDYTNLTEASMSWALDEILNHKKYSIKARVMSARYRDQPLPPLELAKFWVEYVVRHGGAPHMHSAGQELGFVAYNNLDVYAVMASVSLIVILSILLLLKKVLCLFCASGKKENNASKKKRI